MGIDLHFAVNASPGLMRTASADGCIDFDHQRWRDYTVLPVKGISRDERLRFVHLNDQALAFAVWRSWPYSHFDAEKDGMGIGSLVCRTIIEIHGGRLATISSDGPGATISFCPTARGGGRSPTEFVDASRHEGTPQ